MSLLSLPERFLRRLVELPLELFNMVLGSQKLLTDAPYDPLFTGWGDGYDGYTGRYQTPAQDAARERRDRLDWKRVLYNLRHEGWWHEDGVPFPIILRMVASSVRNPRKRVREDTGLPPAKRQSVPRLFVL